MTYERREEIFSKEVLTVSDIQELFDCGYQEAAKKLRDMKRVSDRLDVQGRIHVSDYLRYFGVDDSVLQLRYTHKMKDAEIQG